MFKDYTKTIFYTLLIFCLMYIAIDFYSDCKDRRDVATCEKSK